MINSIQLTNFRKFSNRRFDFPDGRIALRGANENGKTTVIEGLRILLGGFSQANNKDFVSWGEKPSKCKIEGVMTFPGGQVRITRSKSGAEIYLPPDAKSPLVTGQTEVTNWITEQMGADMETISRMSFVQQKEIGGLLDERSGKLVEFIEEMSDLGVFEFVQEALTIRGNLGSTTLIDEQTLAAEQQLQDAEAVDYKAAAEHCEAMLPTAEADVENHRAGLETARKLIAGLRERRAEISLNATTARGALLTWQDLQKEEARIKLELDASRVALGLLPTVDSLQVQLTTAESLLPDFLQHDRLKALRAQFDSHQALLARTDPDEWEGSVRALDDMITETSEEHAKIASIATAQIEQARSSGRQAQKLRASQVEVGKKCPTCGTPIADAENAAEHNAELLRQAADLEAKEVEILASVEKYQKQADEQAELLNTLRAIRRRDTPGWASSNPEQVRLDPGFYPPRIEWIGPDLGQAPVDPRPVAKDLQQQINKIGLLQGKIDEQEKSLANATRRALQVEDDFKMFQAKADADEDLAGLDARIEDTQRAIARVEIAMQAAQDHLANVRADIKVMQGQVAKHDQELAGLRAQVAGLKAKAELYEFNNGLMKAVQMARPLAANKLWEMVLHPVSTYTTQMRQEPSIIAREGKEFTINGNPVTSLSGSGQDVVALSMRVALTKVFVPTSDMIVLDEPFTACDAERTMQCLSFAVSAGFPQIIIITHENQTEGLFDHIIEV